MTLILIWIYDKNKLIDVKTNNEENYYITKKLYCIKVMKRAGLWKISWDVNENENNQADMKLLADLSDHFDEGEKLLVESKR